jgi:heme exporter protein A
VIYLGALVSELPAIELRGLGRRYGANFVLRDVNLSVSAGRTLVLRGANGAGKTTLLRVLSTRLRPSRGEGRVFGFDLTKEAHRVRERVAYLSVFGGSYGALTAGENLALAARLYGRRVNVEAYLERVGLADARHKLVRTFSSGMKKRLGVARVLLSEADLWLLDEPHAALDEAGRELIDRLLQQARDERKTVLMASHELERSARFADRMLDVAGGTLVLAEDFVPRAPLEVSRA